MTTKQIERAVTLKYEKKSYDVIPNVHWGFYNIHECDLLDYQELIPDKAGILVCRQSKHRIFVDGIRKPRPELGEKSFQKLTQEQMLTFYRLGTKRMANLKQTIDMQSREAKYLWKSNVKARRIINKLWGKRGKRNH
jgi:hypothetical protein